MGNRKVALVELGASHDECVLSQLVALKSVGCHVTVVALKEVVDRNQFWEELVDQYHLLDFPKTAIGDFLLMKNLNRFFKVNKIETVVLNTAQGGHVRNLCLTASRRTQFVGIIHTLRKFEGSFTQKIIHRKIKNYLVLNDFFLERILPPKGCKIESFYPLRFPDFPKENLKKNKEERWVTLIGGVENRRKDLNGSLELMQTTKDLTIKFIFLGKSDPAKDEVKLFLDQLHKYNLMDRVVLFNDFVSPQAFDAYLKKSDLIWPMVHPNTPSAQEYFRNQISGAINVAFAYKIPLFVHEEYTKDWKDLHSASSYSLESFKMDLCQAFEDLPDKKQLLENNPKFDPKFQERKYVSFVLGLNKD